MDAEKAAENLKVIRQLMERPIRYSTMSGWSGIFAGCVAIVGLVLDSAVYGAYRDPVEAMWFNLGVWAAILVIAFAGVTTLTLLRERAQGIPLWSAAKRRFLMTILPAFIAGAGLTLAIVYRWYWQVGPNQWGLIPAIWMLFYGVACWQVGAFSIGEMRVMGAAFILAGIVTSAFFQYNIPGVTAPLAGSGFTLGLAAGSAPYWTLGATFGGFHILYGIVVLTRHGG
jgi:hypothetical protein